VAAQYQQQDSNHPCPWHVEIVLTDDCRIVQIDDVSVIMMLVVGRHVGEVDIDGVCGCGRIRAFAVVKVHMQRHKPREQHSGHE
jgi:hypothetical protein